MSKLPVQYIRGYRAAGLLMAECPWLERAEVRQESALLVAEALARGQTILRTEYILGELRNKLVTSQVKARRRAWVAATGAPSPDELASRARKCTKPGHVPPTRGRCRHCLVEGRRRWRARQRDILARSTAIHEESGPVP